MATVLQSCVTYGTTDFNAVGLNGVVSFGSCNYLHQNLVNTTNQIIFRTAGTFTNLRVVIPTNTRAGAVTLTCRKNGTNVNLTVTLPGTTTGTFQDTGNTDTVSAGDLFDFHIAKGGSSGTCFCDHISVHYTTSSCVSRIVGWNNAFGIGTGGTSIYRALIGRVSNGPSATESAVSARIPLAGTFRNGALHVQTNTRNGATTYTFRKNSADTALVLTIPTTTTGVFEDTSNSISVSVADLCNWKVGSGGSSGTVTVNHQAIDFESTGVDSWFGTFGASTGGGSTNAGSTNYTCVSGSLEQSPTESDVAKQFGKLEQIKGISIYVSSNLHSGCTCTLRVNAADSSLVLSIPNTTSGWFSTTGSVLLQPSDLVDTELTAGGTFGLLWLHIIYNAQPGDPPVVTCTGGTTLTFNEGDAATVIDAGVTVTDPDSTDLSAAVVSITGNYDGGEDILSFTNQNGISGSWSGPSMTLSGTSSVANYQTALRDVKYQNTDTTNPSTATRTISFQVTDELGLTSNICTSNVAIAGVNDPPVINCPNSPLDYAEGDGAIAIDGGTTVTDPDDSNLTGATVAITNNYQFGQDVLSFTNAFGITGSWNALTGVLTLSGTTTVANYQSALRTVKYNAVTTPIAQIPRTVTFTVDDGH